MRKLILAITILFTITGGTFAKNKRTVSVSGQGRASAPPDVATINTGVSTMAANAQDALNENNDAMLEVLEVLTEFGIDEKDKQTSGFSIYPDYDLPKRDGTSVIIGYRVTNRVTVKVRTLDNLGAILDALVQAGSNLMSGISFGIADTTEITNQARKNAITDAQNRAELYAKRAGVGVGKLLSISEHSTQVASRGDYGYGLEAAPPSSVPVATGEHEVYATIYMVYALTD